MVRLLSPKLKASAFKLKFNPWIIFLPMFSVASSLNLKHSQASFTNLTWSPSWFFSVVWLHMLFWDTHSHILILPSSPIPECKITFLTCNWEYSSGLVVAFGALIYYGALYFPSSLMQRPHYSFWRMVLGVSLCYCCTIIFILFQVSLFFWERLMLTFFQKTKEDINFFFKTFFDKELGKPLPEKVLSLSISVSILMIIRIMLKIVVSILLVTQNPASPILEYHIHLKEYCC